MRALIIIAVIIAGLFYFNKKSKQEDQGIYTVKVTYDPIQLNNNSPLTGEGIGAIS